jgi:O-acetyl-ADP-ribose deacetylase (regulator of RNase III)
VLSECYVQAFPCISTGIYGYPNDKAAEVALRTVRSFLEKNHQVQAPVLWILAIKFKKIKAQALEKVLK